MAQNDITNSFNSAYEMVQQGNCAQALPRFREILRVTRSYSQAHQMASWCYLMQGDIASASHHADLCLLFDPFSAGSYAIRSYADYAAGNAASGETYLKTALWLSYSDNDIGYYLKDFDDLISAGVATSTFSSLKSSAPALFASRDKSFLKAGLHVIRASEYLQAGNITAAAAELTNSIGAADFPNEKHVFRALMRYNAALMMSNFRRWQESIPFFEQAHEEFARTPEAPVFPKIIATLNLANSYQNEFDSERAATLLIGNLQAVMALPDEALFEKGQYLDALCRSEISLYRPEALKEHAATLLRIAQALQDAQLYVNANHYLGVAFQPSENASDRQKSDRYFREALATAQANGLEAAEIDIKSNYMLLKFYNGETAAVLQLADEVASYAIKNGNYESAETTYNNLGAMYYTTNDFVNAAANFTRSIEIVENFRNAYSGEQKLTFMARGVSSYQFLSACLAQARDTRKLFEIQNLQRGRVLSELLNSNQASATISLEAFQKFLAPDEAALIYTLLEPGAVVINVVTSSTSAAVLHKQFEGFYTLKKKYLDRFNGNGKKPGYKPSTQLQSNSEHDMAIQVSKDDFDDMMSITRDLIKKTGEPFATVRKEFLRNYYDMLIHPVTARLQGIKKLIIMPDGVLNFLPFEILPDAGGQALIESFDIRYTQSAQVKSIIENRKYPPRTKSILAMGGALYDEMNEKAAPIVSADQLIALQNRAKENLKDHLSQRTIYASLGFGKMPYLDGTLAEVKAIQPLFPDGSEVYTGAQMTETFLKSLSHSGALKQFKVIHLATHGFALPEIPQLSGIAMCIYPDAQNGDDGYLTAPEIANLGMQADIAVLSACETGLGKIYGGEGVAGLTQSLLIGGANGAIVSLWPVSDLGTMHFMTGVYRLTEKEGKSYHEAVSIMKRRFLAGEFGPEFTNPDIWAPFVYYGK